MLELRLGFDQSGRVAITGSHRDYFVLSRAEESHFFGSEQQLVLTIRVVASPSVDFVSVKPNNEMVLANHNLLNGLHDWQLNFLETIRLTDVFALAQEAESVFAQGAQLQFVGFFVAEFG